MGLIFQAIVLSSALLPSIIATGVFETHCAVPGVIGDAKGDSCGLLSLTTPTVVPTDGENDGGNDGETVTLSPNSEITPPPSPLSIRTVAPALKRDFIRTTYTAWPSVVTIIPVTPYVPVPQANLIPCTAWFFFICVSWNRNSGDIGGWQLTLQPGVYPPGPPPGFRLPPGFSISGDLAIWPPLTIGYDNVPIFASRPRVCPVTRSATLFINTVTYGVTTTTLGWITSKLTTATSIVSTSSIIYGCDAVTSNTATPTILPTTSKNSTSTPTSTPSSTSAPTSTPSSTSAPTSTPSPTSTTKTIQSSSSTTQTAPSPTKTWHLTMYDNACKEDAKDYYSLRGYGQLADHMDCISLKGGHVPLASDTGNSCEFFPNGGNSPGKACSEGTFFTPTSFVIRDGYCVVYDEYNCEGYSSKFFTPLYNGCVNVKDAISPPKNWASMKCYAQ